MVTVLASASLVADSSLGTTATRVVTAAVALSASSALTAGVQLTLPVSQGVVYYVRVLPAGAILGSGTVRWTSVPRVMALVVATPGVVDSTPASLMVNVGNGVPGEGVDFSVDGGPILTSGVLDSAGSIMAASVPLPVLTVGSHVMIAATNTAYGAITFTVTNPPTPYPTTRPPDLGPAAIVQMGVVKWVLQDPSSGGTNFIFPINPHKMSAPHAARVFATEHSTAPDGQPLTFEGSSVGVDWVFEGFCRTQGFHDALEVFLARPRRVYLVDHLSRAWTVTVESIAWTRLHEAYNDWAFTYVLKAIIYAGPVQL